MLYHFPSEPVVLKSLCDDALDELRWRLRIPVIRQFGTAAVECFAVVSRCSDCDHVSAALRAVSSSTFDASYTQLLEFVSANSTWQEAGMMPDECPACASSNLQTVSVFLAKYLPALGRDFQISITFHAGRVHRTAIHLMDVQGQLEPVTLSDLNAEGSPPLSIRAAWRHLISTGLFSQECLTRQVAPGYVIGLRPYSDSPWVTHGLNLQLESFIEQHEADGFDVFSAMHDLEALNLGLSHADIYSNWLGAFAGDITCGTIEPFILVRSKEFIDALRTEANRLGLSVERVGKPVDLLVRFSNDDLHVEVNLARVLMRIIHTGLGFSEGIVEFFGRELSGIRAGAEAIPLMRSALPMLSLSIRDGIKLAMTDSEGRQISCLDVIQLATTFNLRDRDEFMAACGEVAPSYAPKMLTLSPHIAGQTARVVRRL